MKLLFVTGEYPPDWGGLADYTSLLAGALAGQGVTVHVLTTGGLAGGDRQVSDVTVHRLPGRWSWRAADAVAGLATALEVDLVHLQYQAAAFDLSAAPTLLLRELRRQVPGLRTAVTFHDLHAPYAFPKAGPVRRELLRRLARSADLAVCSDPGDAATVATWVRDARVCTIPIGSNIPWHPLSQQQAQELRAQAAAPEGGFLAGYFGFTHPSKGLGSLIAGFARFHMTYPEARLVLIGAAMGASDPTNRATNEQLEGMLESHGLAASVYRTGPLAPLEVSAWLQTIDACVLPYRDGWSWRRGTLLAALSNAVPVVTTAPPEPPAPGDLPRLVDGRNALLVPPDDPQELAAALEQLARDGQLRAALAVAGRQTSEAFSWDRIATAHLEAYRSLA